MVWVQSMYTLARTNTQTNKQTNKQRTNKQTNKLTEKILNLSPVQLTVSNPRQSSVDSISLFVSDLSQAVSMLDSTVSAQWCGYSACILAQTNKQTNKQTSKQANKQRNKQTKKQTNKQTNKNKQKQKQTQKQNKQTTN